MENARKRILYFLENQKIAPSDFLRKTGLKKGIIDRSHQESGASDVFLSKILEAYPSLSAKWLLTGNGDMLMEENHAKFKSFKLKTDNNIQNQLIPIYNIKASAGLVNLFDSTQRQEVVDTIKIPNLPSCDGAVFVQGDSMYPLLKSGDIVAYKQITDFKNDIYWGEMYLISIEMAGEEYVSVKFIQKSEKGEDYICLVSQNQCHASKDVHLSKVRAMALIKASIRLNSMG